MLPPGAAEELFDLPESMGVAFTWHCLLNATLARAERQFAFPLSSVLPVATILVILLSQYPTNMLFPKFELHLSQFYI